MTPLVLLIGAVVALLAVAALLDLNSRRHRRQQTLSHEDQGLRALAQRDAVRLRKQEPPRNPLGPPSPGGL